MRRMGTWRMKVIMVIRVESEVIVKGLVKWLKEMVLVWMKCAF